MSRLCVCIAVDSRTTYLLRQSSAGGAKSTNYSLELPAKELFLLLLSRSWPLEDDYGYSSVTLTYPNGSSEYLWVDSTDYAPVSDEYTDTGAKNIVIPDGTEVSVEYGSITLTPSEVYYDVDYTEYT